MQNDSTPPLEGDRARVKIVKIAGQPSLTHSPPLSQVTHESVAWQRFRAAAFRHDLEHSVGSWIERQHTYGEWSALFLAQNFEEATHFYKRAVERAPERFTFWGNLGESQYFACDTGYRDSFTTALEFAATQIRLNPTYVVAYSRSAVFRAYLGDSDRSDALIQQALEMAPDSPDVAYDHTVVLARLDRTVQNREAVARLNELKYTPLIIESDVTLRLDLPMRDGEPCF